jgi:hypothetical protein
VVSGNIALHSRQAILVVGYYRTGTSALSGALVEAGVKMPNDTEANEHNPKGFFEDTSLIQFDMDLLNALGSIWSDLRFLPEGWLSRPDMSLYRERLAGLVRAKLADAPIVALKHPHLCRLFPIYQAVLQDLGIRVSAIHTYRSPLVIATSQQKKNGLPRAHGLLLWASYMVDAERNTREVPRAWIAYEDLLRDQAGAVQSTLEAVGVTGLPASGGFVTDALRRSAAAPTEGLFAPLQHLVNDIETAIIEQAGPGRWDSFRDRVADMVGFLAELGATNNRAVPGIGEIAIARQAGIGATLGTGASEGHRLRPAERTDPAARTRTEGKLAARELPTLAVIVVVPSQMGARREATLASLRAGWRRPDKLLVIQAGKLEGPQGVTTVTVDDDEALATELWRRVNAEQHTDFVAILNAGDTVEPDAVARMALAAMAGEPTPAMLYCDEIVASGEHPWIRTKPEWDLHRLRESCFVGDWVWYASDAIRSLGGFSARYAGSEEQDLQLKIAERGLPVVRVPEALFVRRAGTRRDAVPLPKAIENAIAAIDDHLGRVHIAGRARSGRFPGTFEVEYPAVASPMAIGLMCERADTKTVNLAAGRILSAMKASDRLVYLTPQIDQDASLSQYLHRVATEVSPRHPGVQVHAGPSTLGATLVALRSTLGEDGYIALVDPTAKPDRDDQFDVLRSVLAASPEVGVAGVRSYWREGETSRLVGPILPGAGARMGANRDAENPGPGGWLAATQKVGAVDGPCLVVRTSALPGTEILAGVTNWADVCEHARERGFSTLWCPVLKAEILRPAQRDVEQEVAGKQRYQPAFHHPGLSLIGDSMLLESRFGLIEESPRAIGNLVSGEAGCHLLSAARALRQLGRISATWAAEPLDPFSARRVMTLGRRWIRLNPNHLFEGVQGYTAAWTRPPITSQHQIVKAAACCVATSEPILRTLRGMGAKRLSLWQPRLERRIWESLPPARGGKPVAMWIDESVPVAWLNTAIKATRNELAWVVVSDAELALPGDVAKLPRPVFEDAWHDLFARLRPTFLVRPTPGANWLDDHTLLMAAAAGCILLAGKESQPERVRSQLGITWLTSDRADCWIKALTARPTTDGGARARILNEARVFWLDETTTIDWLDGDDGGPAATALEVKVA